MSQARTTRDYDRWLAGRTMSGLSFRFLETVPGHMLNNTPVFRFDRELGLRPEQRLLDIGCGRGSLMTIVGNRVHFQRPPVGLDASRTTLSLARRDLAAAGQEMPLVQGAATGLPLRDDLFDVATCGHLVKHLDDDELVSFLRDVRRVLKPGGIAVVWEFAPTGSRRLDAWNRRVLTQGVSTCNLRPFTDLAAAGTAAGFEWVENARLRPFLFPPIPRVSLVLGKAPEAWRERTGPGRARRAALGTRTQSEAQQ